MIVIPKDNPLKTGLNTYFLKVERFFEHFQGIVDASCACFKSPSAEGAVYFDEENLINAVFIKNKASIKKGKEAIDILMDETGANNFSVAIYEIMPEHITYWANLSDAEDLHKDLSSEFTDLEGLIKKKASEKLTGHIEAVFSESDSAVVYLLNGEIIGVASSDKKWELFSADEVLTELIDKSREKGSIFNVRNIPMKMNTIDYTASSKAEPVKKETVKKENKTPEPKKESLKIIPMLQHLMLFYEKCIVGNKKISEDFETILRRKFMEKVDIYSFLDPFAAEFQYSQGKITYTGTASLSQMTEGLIQCLDEIADENRMKKWLSKHLGSWEEKYAGEIRALSSRNLNSLLSFANPESKPMAVKPDSSSMVFREAKF